MKPQHYSGFIRDENPYLPLGWAPELLEICVEALPGLVHPILFAMPYDYKFGPAAQTPEQRAWVLAQMQEMSPRLKTNVTSQAQQLYARYVAGELGWMEMRYALDATKALP